MKSRTSFFNATVLRKNITRYAPVWGLYAIGLLLILFIPNMSWGADDAADALLESLTAMAPVNAILGGICSLMVFGDLFKTRLCYATHALPLRREGWFLTHYTSGLLFSFVPNLVIAGLFCFILQHHWYIAALWLAVVTLQYLFFFGVGAFSAACAGNRLGAAAGYLILNFFALLIGWYAENIYTPLLYGLEFNSTTLEMLMPMTYMGNFDYLNYMRMPFTVLDVPTKEWVYLAIVAGIGLLFALLALLLYRKRHLETAGDFLSFKGAKPIFLVVYTLAVGYLFSQILSEYPLLGLLAGLAIGFFTGKMLLERTVKVFRGFNFLFFGVIVTALFLSIGLTALDPMGMTRHVPKTENIEAMYFYDSSDRYRYQEEEDSRWTISDPAEIEEFRQFHRDVINAGKPSLEGDHVSVYVHYELKNGRTMLRKYDVPVDSTHGEFIRQKLSSWQGVFHTNDWSEVTDNLYQVDLEIRVNEQIGQAQITEPAQILGLLEAIRLDCDAGNMSQNWSFHQEEESAAWVYIYDSDYYETYTDHPYKVYTYNLNVYESCSHTIAYLDSLAIVPEPYEK